jgi:hypothetical protein
VLSYQIRDSYEVNPVTAKVRFERQYKPVRFGDPPDPRTVDGKRRSALKNLNGGDAPAKLHSGRCRVRGTASGPWLVRLVTCLGLNSREVSFVKFGSWKGWAIAWWANPFI